MSQPCGASRAKRRTSRFWLGPYSRGWLGTREAEGVAAGDAELKGLGDARELGVDVGEAVTPVGDDEVLVPRTSWVK